jgi:hypothetical protein
MSVAAYRWNAALNRWTEFHADLLIPAVASQPDFHSPSPSQAAVLSAESRQIRRSKVEVLPIVGFSRTLRGFRQWGGFGRLLDPRQTRQPRSQRSTQSAGEPVFGEPHTPAETNFQIGPRMAPAARPAGSAGPTSGWRGKADSSGSRCQKAALTFFARAFNPGVTQPDDDLCGAVFGDGGLDDRRKEGAGHPMGCG